MGRHPMRFIVNHWIFAFRGSVSDHTVPCTATWQMPPDQIPRRTSCSMQNRKMSALPGTRIRPHWLLEALLAHGTRSPKIKRVNLGTHKKIYSTASAAGLDGPSQD